MDKVYAIKKMPESHQKDIQTAVDILKEEGCKEIYLFGSLVNGDFTEKSDVDLAVKGLKKRNFFKILGKLIMALDHSVDLVNLEKKDRFSAMLKKKGELLRVA
ncbi:MAG: nucleotidyltransferase domain-containing protein [Candidatus Aminicenantes bacterium]|nr:nucleotidyltransferase domain-containing protein [Candidatus Aminicenantes bacterium]NIM77295.1 nucleotidyltransferase domain-containing protein [Candidatus Aminicenantes bacterium]NIN16596.1 nucleotidyltransferase domain-containing protein [Candidatus Aminicenantes bacterium]NIN40454.1 nucleotidyltransferase domain-containing protein [Candidatus Aminicenantes bacterium]NIN83274.1 nucleotidyltransferase domain-containing protein [Candidatus Aminicenantes bacterium]